MANTLTDLKDVRIAQAALMPWMTELMPLSIFSTNFGPTSADKGDTVKVPVVGAPSPSSDFDGNYVKNIDSEANTIPVVLNKHKFKTVHMTAKEAATTAVPLLEKLRVYAAETPFEFGDISDAGKTLLSMCTAAEKSIEVIRKLGDIASVSGKTLKELAFLYAKVQNSGLSNEVAESLEMQGVPIRKLIAEMKGISFEDVFKGISKRQFNLDDLDAALDKLTGPGGLLENMTKLQSQTFSGALSTLTDGFSALDVEMGTPINAPILPVLADLTAYVDSLTPTIRQFGQTLATIFEGTVSIITPIVSGIGELVSLLGGAETVIASAAAAMLMYVGNTKTATTSTVSFRAQLVAMGNTIKGLSFSSFVTGYRTALSGLKTAMSSTLAGLKVTWSIAWSTMATVTRAAMVAVKAAIVSTGIGLV